MADNKRFKVIYKQGAISSYKVIKDTVTGVLYMWHGEGGYAGGITPLLDSEGKPIIEPGR